MKFGDSYAKRVAARCLARVAPEALLEAIEDPFIADALKLFEIYVRAQALHYAGEPQLAAEVYEEAPAILRKANVNRGSKIGEFFELIIGSFELGYYSQCVSLLKNAIELDPKEAMLRSNLGIAYRVMREYSLSLEMYQQSLRLKPFGSIEVSNGLGILSYVQGKEEQAIEHFSRSLQLSFDPDIGGPFERYWKYEHDIHMLTIALVGAGHGGLALQRLQIVMPVIRWEPGVITEILWDIEQLEEVNPALPALSETLALLRTTQAKLEERRRGPLRS